MTMTLNLLARPVFYLRHHGLLATGRRALLACRHGLLFHRQILFFCDLRALLSAEPRVSPATIERKTSMAELEAGDLAQILTTAEPAEVRRRIAERFARGAVLWLCKLDHKLAGYGWSLVGQTVEPHFFPLGSNDAHLFDFLVLPDFRGRRIHSIMVMHVLTELARENRSRAFFEADEWNDAVLRSFNRMPVERMGRASRFLLFGRTFAVWSEGNSKTRPVVSAAQSKAQATPQT